MLEHDQEYASNDCLKHVWAESLLWPHQDVVYIADVHLI